MRAVIWFVLLFVVAVVAATTLGGNDGLVSIYWAGQRLDVSLNFFLILLAVLCALLVTAFNAINALVGLPQRAREWRVSRRDRAAQARAWVANRLVESFGREGEALLAPRLAGCDSPFGPVAALMNRAREALHESLKEL